MYYIEVEKYSHAECILISIYRTTIVNYNMTTITYLLVGRYNYHIAQIA